MWWTNKVAVTRKQADDELGTGVPDALLNSLIEEQLDRWGRESFDARGQVGMSQELEHVLLHILAEG